LLTNYNLEESELKLLGESNQMATHIIGISRSIESYPLNT